MLIRATSRRSLWRVVGLVVVTIALSACGGRLIWPGSGFSVHVTNGTDKSWFVSVPLDTSSHPAKAVAKIDPGADGFSVWFPDADSVISALGPDCSVVAAFRDDGTGKLVVDALPGLTGYLEKGTKPGGDGMTITITSECGGEVSM